MWFWWFMFCCNLLYPLAFLLGGWYMWKHAPKKPNAYSGFRSRLARMNEETWRFAQEHCGRRWWKIGWILLLPTILVQLPFYGSSDDTVGAVGLVICVVEVGIMLLNIRPTEKALRENFTDSGERK